MHADLYFAILATALHVEVELGNLRLECINLRLVCTSTCPETTSTSMAFNANSENCQKQVS